MPRSIVRWSAAVVVIAALVALFGRARAAESPLAGQWKLMDVSSGNEVSLIILRVEEKDGKATATSLSAPLLSEKELKLANVRLDGNALHFTFALGRRVISVDVTAPKGADKPKTLRGVLKVDGVAVFVEMERTDQKTIDKENAAKKRPGGKEVEEAENLDDAKKQEAVLKELIEKYPDTTTGYAAAQLLLGVKVRAGAKDEELKALADRMAKIGAAYSPVLEQHTSLIVAQTLVMGEKTLPLALVYARQAEKALAKDAPPAQVAPVFKVLEAALRKSGKVEEADAIAVRIGKLFDFEPEPFKGRKGKSSRVAVVELFTGAQCPPCVAADIAFDAVAASYKPADVVLLQYHLHIPGPDPLTNADSEKRQEYYGRSIRGTPTMFLNGAVTEGMGGYKEHGKGCYEALSELINKALEADDQAELKLNVQRKGDKLDISADVKGLKKPGDKVRLRFVLVEEAVRYPARNGQKLHHHVVRAFPGGIDGFVLKEAMAKQAITVLLGDLKKSLTEYLDKYAKDEAAFPDANRPLDLKHLKVIALVQDDETKEILQAAQVDVPEGK